LRLQQQSGRGLSTIAIRHAAGNSVDAVLAGLTQQNSTDKRQQQTEEDTMHRWF
jgi:hypothetical protein